LVRRFGPELRLVIILNTDSIIYSKKIMHLLMLPVMRKLGNTLILFFLNIARCNCCSKWLHWCCLFSYSSFCLCTGSFPFYVLILNERGASILVYFRLNLQFIFSLPDPAASVMWSIAITFLLTFVIRPSVIIINISHFYCFLWSYSYQTNIRTKLCSNVSEVLCSWKCLISSW
jgi:hypothetical protein